MTGAGRADGDAQGGWRRPRHPALHLVWAVPLGASCALVTLAFASFVRCGITACHWGDKGSIVAVGAYSLLAGLLLACPFWSVRWTTRPRVRFAVGLVLALGVFVWGFASISRL